MQQLNKIYETNINDKIKYDIIILFEEQIKGKFYIKGKKNIEFIIPNTIDMKHKWYKINNTLKIYIYDKIKEYILITNLINQDNLVALTLNNFVISKNNKESLINTNSINSIDKKYRSLTFILFLNDTGNIIISNNKINSEQGKLIIFPSECNYNIEIQNDSFLYIITGYLYNSYVLI